MRVRPFFSFCCHAALALCLATSSASAERPQGLLWNRSGLPATLPLQVKTASGADYLLELRAPGADRTLLAAFIRGGTFFRVLVPAGRYELWFTSGTEWLGDAARFGPDATHFRLDPPLTFRATASRRNGYLIDLRDREAIAVRDFALCQRVARRPDGNLFGTAMDRAPVIPRPEPRYTELSEHDVLAWRFDVPERVCD